MQRLRAFRRTHPIVTVLIGLAVVLLGATAWAASQLLRVPEVEVSFAVPTAPQLTPASPSETIYRIDASRSSATYEVTEQLAGTEHTATGSTSGIAGDIGLDRADPTAARLGEVVINVQQLTSDQALRDQRLQHDFLESQTYPLATYRASSIDGLPDAVADGQTYDVTVRGDLTVKETTAPVELDASVRADGAELHIDAEATVSLEAFGVGPINLIGFVSAADEARLRFDLVAVDADELEAPNQIAAPQRVETAAVGGPSFAATVQPVLEANCASCHNDGGVGASVWRLEQASDASEVASGLGLAVGAGYMPPWPASDVGIPLQHSMALDQSEIDAVVAWAEAGGPLDVDPSTPIANTVEPAVSIRPDVELTLAEPYVGSTDVRNDYRCFVVDPGFTEPTAISGYEFVPDKDEILHHALAFRVDKASAEKLRQSDADDEGSGWTCAAGAGMGVGALGGGGGSPTTGTYSQQFMAWAPGQVPSQFPEGSGLQFAPGDVVMLQIHYHFVHETPPDQSTLRLQRADGTHDELDPIEYSLYLAPAEIPCTPDETGPLCDRDAELARLNGEFGPVGALIANGLHALCGTTVDEIAVLDGTQASVSCDHRVARPGEILGIFGHMHELGVHYRMTLNPDTPDEQVLLDIPAWDFGWQLNYQPAEQVILERGDVIRVECTWDRALMAGEPKWVTWSEGTEDEMCYSAVTTRRIR